MKIRTAIFLVYVAASAVGMVVLMRFILAEVRPRYVTAVQGNLQDAVQMVARGLKDQSAQEAAVILSGRTGFRVQLNQADGRVLFDSRAVISPEGEGYEDASATRVVARQVSMRLIDSEADQNALEVSANAPVLLADGMDATLKFSRSFRSMNEVIWAERKKLTFIALFISGVMVVAGWWISAQLTRSLERLTLYVQQVRDGRPASPPQSRATEIAALGTAFEQMRDALEGRQHAERYTQALAHEVKAPLAAIRGAAELLDEEMPVEQRTKFLANIRGESARIQQIVDRLLELSSLEARKTLRQTEIMTGSELAEEAAAVVRPAYAARSVNLNLTLTNAKVQGERVLLREALVNLLHNALDFSPMGSAVEFTVTESEGLVNFSIEDQGPGVPDYALGQVFERFYSLPRPGSTRKSTGLGLALVREVALLHGGEVTLVNRKTGGASAVLRISVA
ncbi:MAG: HAMP domain-containing protein [Cephaloticoccus sp.]|nr:HAMP domain-containing protein [Cephaloticoccus sp.]MCF7761578.1 HAMP domain-containing protein [Cephaloticoccus sp.]